MYDFEMSLICILAMTNLTFERHFYFVVLLYVYLDRLFHHMKHDNQDIFFILKVYQFFPNWILIFCESYLWSFTAYYVYKSRCVFLAPLFSSYLIWKPEENIEKLPINPSSSRAPFESPRFIQARTPLSPTIFVIVNTDWR